MSACQQGDDMKQASTCEMSWGLNMVRWACQDTPQRGHGADLERLAQLVDALGSVHAPSVIVDTTEGIMIQSVRQVQAKCMLVGADTLGREAGALDALESWAD